MKILQQLLDERIRALGISEREVARWIGISPNTISRARNGESVDVDTLIEICAWLEVPPSIILDAQLPAPRTQEEAFAAILAISPELEQVFAEIYERLRTGEIDQQDLAEIARYAKFRFEARSD